MSSAQGQNPPPVVDPALYSHQERPEQDIASRLHDQFFARTNPSYYPAYHPQDTAHPTADTEAALQAIATAAQGHDRRASTASSASAGGAVKPDGHRYAHDTSLPSRMVNSKAGPGCSNAPCTHIFGLGDLDEVSSPTTESKRSRESSSTLLQS